MNEAVAARIVDLYDECVRDADSGSGVKVSEAKSAIRDAVREIVAATERDIDRETDEWIESSISSVRGKRSRSLKRQLEYLLDGMGEDGAYVDPLLNMAFNLGDEHGVDRPLRNWSEDNLRDLTVTRYKVAAEVTAAAADFHATAQRVIDRMRAGGCLHVGDVEWDDGA